MFKKALRSKGFGGLFAIGAILTSIVLIVSCGGPTSPSEPVDITGTYTLTLTASNICGLIAGRVSSYSAKIIQSGSEVIVDLTVSTGSPFFSNVKGEVTGNSVRLYFGIDENVRSGDWYSILGKGTGNVTGTNISGALSGNFNYYFSDYDEDVDCNAANHQFSFTRR